MDAQTTGDIATARRWASEMGGDSHPAHFFFSPNRFVVGERTDDSLSLTLSGEQCYGLGFGPTPPVNPEWTRCSIDHTPFGTTLGQMVSNDRWDFYSIDVKLAEASAPVHVMHDDAIINQILDEYAPHLQTRPGDPEIVDWYGVRDSDGRWVSLGALVRWESGRLLISSVVTVADARGRGFARVLTRGIAGEARRLGERWLGLGVAHDNLAAQRTYQQSGFVCRANFTSYALE